MATVPNGVETLPKILIVWVGCTNVTDDRPQTDGRPMTYSEREREFTFAKTLLSAKYPSVTDMLLAWDCLRLFVAAD